MFRKFANRFKKSSAKDESCITTEVGSERRNEAPVIPTPELPDPLPPALFEKPWRIYNDLKGKEWSRENEQQLKDYISKIEEQINLLFVGQVSSGKSSTINSMISIANNRISERSKAGEGDKSFTIHFQVIRGSDIFKNITFYDFMGLEVSANDGARKEDIVSATTGSISPGVALNAASKCDTCTADESRKIHCMIYVVDAQNAALGDVKEFKEKIRKIEDDLKIGPNRVVFVTKIDQLCPEVRENIMNVFYSKEVFEAVKNASKLVGVPLNKVFPIQNYVEAVELDEFSNIPLLIALKSAVNLGLDSIEGARRDNNKGGQTETN